VVTFTEEELKIHKEDNAKLKAQTAKQKIWFSVAFYVFFAMCLSSSYLWVYKSDNKTRLYFFGPVQYVLNAAILIVLFRMRYIIQKAPSLLLSEVNFIIHEVVFFSYTLLWTL